MDAESTRPAPLSRRAFGRFGVLTLGVVAAMPLIDWSSPALNRRMQRENRIDSGWRVSGMRTVRDGVTLPDSVARQSWRDWDPKTWEGEWHYRNSFDLPPAPEDGTYRYFLRFDGALSAITPNLNGHVLGTHRGGYLPAEYEITRYVRGRDNRLDVALDGSFEVDVPPNRPGRPSNTVDFWQLAGLYREVTLRVRPQAFLTELHAVPRAVLDPLRRTVDVRLRVDGRMPDPRVRVELLDGERILGSASTVPDAQGRVRTGIGGLRDVELWELDAPKSYRLRATLYSGREPVHEESAPVGFRTAEFTTEGFFLNGHRRTIIGLNRHQIFPYVGAAMPPRVQRRDARILKDLNVTMVRCSHYPQHEAFLEACDELGILVFEEAPGWGALGDGTWKRYVRRDVRDMILRDRNHPSIVLWGVRLNETPADSELYADTQRIAAELDGSRQTTGAIIGGDYGTEDFLQDVFSYNDYDSQQVDGKRLPKLKQPRENWPWLVTESVGTLSGPASFYRRTDPVTAQHGQALAHAYVHEQAAADPRCCGALGWAGFDYPSGNGNQYQGVKYPGVLDQFREPKLGAAVYAAQVDPNRRVVIEPAFYWDFHGEFAVGELGDDALIFANAGRLELFLDGAPFAELLPDRGRFPHLPYAPFRADFSRVSGGELRIDAYQGARLLGSRRFSADHEGDRLALSADDSEIRADGADATRVVLRVTDRHGAPRPGRAGSVRLRLRGPGELLGDNPFPLAETGGVAAVWVRGRPGRIGTVRIGAVHPELPSNDVTIRMGDRA
ncbi:glycoside hydrolase family 2 protein [Sciscionella marina]|uniref:glycoside hydrolase family 2 protein n=1 Tax=Sciscionella marina TaxID=508770 RepID=UPI00037B0C3D|nr:glycoside hydrolase family 2 TIM barrel-domain containing protein [Sciscionella marina]